MVGDAPPAACLVWAGALKVTAALSAPRGNRAALPDKERENWALMMLGVTGTPTVAVSGLPELPAAMVASLEQSALVLGIVQLQPVPLVPVTDLAAAAILRVTDLFGEAGCRPVRHPDRPLRAEIG